MLNNQLPSLEDREGNSVPENLPGVIDSHVHVFPEKLFRSIWDWFDTHAWPIRYRMTTEAIFEFLLNRGIEHIVALQYAHRPGMSDELNSYMASECEKFPGRVTGLATVFPGEEDAEEILKRGFGMGLKGVKLHAHVQCFHLDGKEAEAIYQACMSENKPIVIHAGREPKSQAYRCDPHEICSAAKLEKVLKNYPRLKVCVPHLGMDELPEYRHLIEKYDNLWIDTTMALAGYFPGYPSPSLRDYRRDRIMYGSDFPNIPYAWDRELKGIADMGLTDSLLKKMLRENPREFFSITGANTP